MWIGAHVSIAKGLTKAVETAITMKANTFQFFIRNPRGGKARDLDPGEIKQARLLMTANTIGFPVAHAPYTYNLASSKEGVRKFSLATLQDDLARMKMMNIPFLVLHPGTHGGQGEEKGMALVVEGLQKVLTLLSANTMILLEGMAGGGTELGYKLEQLAEIIRGCDYHPGLGVCLDSCHLTGAGYDLADFSRIKEEIDQILGWDKVKVFHLNDSLFPLGSRRDRHAKLGEGYLSLHTIKKIICDKDMANIPLILETPNDEEGYAREIELIREMLS
jgi:deoxyribonuclease-4